MIFKPYPYQQHAIEHIVKHKAAGLFLEMGLGKTVVTLTAIELLLYDYFEIEKVLVIAPLRVAEDVWTTEIEKWDHLGHLKIAKVLGTEKDRKQALKEKADIYVMNRENVAWLVSYYDSSWPFDMTVIDELSSFKSFKSQRFKSLRMVRPLMKRIVGLTGTPAPNSLIDLWSQLYLLDRGERLFKTITQYRETFFKPDKHNGQRVFSYKLIQDSEKQIHQRISDICISMKTEDYLSLPEKIERTMEITMPKTIMEKYQNFERDKILELVYDEEINAVNAAALTNKLLQFANGALYKDDKTFIELHQLKLDRLEEIVDVANGQPVLLFYTYKHDLIRIQQRFKKIKPVTIKNSSDIELWNKGEIQLLLAHPASAGHGLNLQAGGHIVVWFGQTWSLEQYQQANARLYRQGQKNNVIINHLIVKGTMDEDVLMALSRKEEKQEALINAVKARIAKYNTVKK